MLGWPRLTVEDVPSTMDLATALAAEGAAEGTVVIARHQSAGRGRAGRRWETPPGTALLCSVVVRPAIPANGLMPLALLAGDAVAMAIQAMTGLEARIKWPNDVLVGDRKIAGVLIQARHAPDRTSMIVGIGINTAIPPGGLPDGATSMLAETGIVPTHDVLLKTVLAFFEQRYHDVLAGSVEGHLHRISQHLAMIGEDVTVQEGSQAVRGRLAGVDHDGALLLEVAGARRRIIAGDVVRGPRRTGARPG
jgi:BirA family biotin operon repressor/biotin-[acetyl-CoA-carboxylase] ligase